MARQRYMAFIILGVAGLITLISLLLHAMNVSRISQSGSGGPDGAETTAATHSDDYTYRSSANALFIRRNAPLLVIVGKRDYMGDDSKDGVYLSFYDVTDKKEIKAKKILSCDRGASVDVQVRRFSDGIYFSLGRKEVYRVDCDSLDAKDDAPDAAGGFQTGPDSSGSEKPHFIFASAKGAGGPRLLRIRDHHDLTPGRSYFDAAIVYGDTSRLLILSRANAAPDAPLSLQSLDPVSGEVRWTLACASDEKPDKAVPFRDGFILVHGNATQTIDSNGKVW